MTRTAGAARVDRTFLGCEAIELGLDQRTNQLVLAQPVVLDAKTEEPDDTADHGKAQNRVHEDERLECHVSSLRLPLGKP